MAGSTESLLSAIRAKAAEERDNLLDEARKRGAAFVKEAAIAHERGQVEAFARLQEEIAARRERVGSETEMVARVGMAEAVRTLIDTVFERAALALSSLEGDRYHAALKRLTAEALERLGDTKGPVRILVAEDDIPMVRGIVAELGINGSVDGKHRERGTVVIWDSRGAHVVDNSFSTRLSQARVSEVPSLATILFPDGASTSDR